MNFFEKFKLKTTLRNCDYKLAGKVIRQQFYVQGKDAEINKLIDEYDSNPCFDTAIKLIDHNELLVFYFTESCTGGLYIRQSEQKEKTEDKLEVANLAVDRNPHENIEVDDTMANRFSINPQKMAAKVDPDKIQHLEESYNWMKDMISKQSGKQSGTIVAPIDEGNFELDLDLGVQTPNNTESQPIQPAKRNASSKEIQQINLAIDSEDIDQETATLVIDTKSLQLRPKTSRKKKEEILVTEEKAETVEVSESTDEQVEEVNLAVDGFEEKIVLEQPTIIKPKREIEVFYETAPLESLPNWVNEIDEDAVIAGTNVVPQKVEAPKVEPAKSIVSELIGDTPPNMDTAPLKSILEDVRTEMEASRIRPVITYSNVINTIQLDIDTMKKQLNDYRRELKINPWDSDQLQAIIRSLEDAIYEFNQAIETLKHNAEQPESE
jgi:hypothetical protein